MIKDTIQIRHNTVNQVDESTINDLLILYFIISVKTKDDQIVKYRIILKKYVDFIFTDN